jgi:hypothetical protein
MAIYPLKNQWSSPAATGRGRAVAIFAGNAENMGRHKRRTGAGRMVDRYQK